MSNILIDNNNILTEVDYSKILKESIERVKDLKVSAKDNKIIFNNIHQIAEKIALELVDKNVLELEFEKKPKVVSTNIKNYTRFSDDIHKLKLEIENSLKNNISSISLNSIEELKNSKVKVKNNFGLEYSFENKVFGKQRVSFEENVISTNAMARVDEVNIKIAVKDIEKNLKNNLMQQLKLNIDDDDDLEDREEDVSGNKQDINKIIKLLNEDILARINRTISYLYLEVLLKDSSPAHTGYRYLNDYIRRFKLLEEYLKELSVKPENESTVIFDTEHNICNILSNGDAFDCLPVIGKIEGVIIEDKDDTYKNFKLGLKVKNNGLVKKEELKENVSSFMYWAKYIVNNLPIENYNKKNRLKAFFLYMFMLNDLGNLNYNPIDKWKIIKNELNVCNGDLKEIDLITRRYGKQLKDDNSENKVNDICEMIEATLNHTRIKDESYNFNRVVTIYKGILDDNLEEGTFFRKQKYDVENLKYVSILECVEDISDMFMTFSININFKSNILYARGNREETTLAYDIKDLKMLPILFYPHNPNDEGAGEKLKNVFSCMSKQSLIGFTYLNEKNLNEKSYAPIYKIIYSLLVNTILLVLLDQLGVENKKELFIPLIRAHMSKSDGEFIRSFSKTLEHVLNQDYLASSQGFDITGNSFKYYNAVSSLYSRLPKIFIEKAHNFNMKKMAMLIVTSHAADASRTSREKSITTILGEVILFDVDENNLVKSTSYRTFIDNVSGDEVFKSSRILRDTVAQIYNLGYKDIFYIAKAPYSSTLNITEEKENLYFMNEDALEGMMDEKAGLMIYPAYFSHYNAFSLKAHKEALYINDNREIDKNLENLNSAIAGIFNLYSGKVVGDGGERKNYRKVILYSTLCNKYENKQCNGKIYNNLIEGSQNKEDITTFITMYHYSKYEKDKDISIKINPYQHLIGDEGVAALSIFDLSKWTKFNNLSFLTEVYKVIKKEK